MKFSANLGFLWTDLSLPEGIRAAKAAGFDAVECHWPYETPIEEVQTALRETGLSMLGLNTIKGETNGLSAVVGMEDEAKQAIDSAITYATEINAGCIHVMAGFTDGSDKAEETFRDNLKYACSKTDKTILIEPLNTKDAPGYHLTRLDHALTIVDELDLENLKIMFDCYHMEIMEGDLAGNLKRSLPHVGHIQFANTPDRGEPDQGEIDFKALFKTVADLGWTTPLGAEYKPRRTTQEGLGWLTSYR